MTYEETAELEQNVKIKNEADKIYSDFKSNVNLKVKNHKGDGKFLHWSDSHNATYFILNKSGTFTFRGEYLHNTYILDVTPGDIFSAIKNDSRSLGHLRSAVRKEANV